MHTFLRFCARRNYISFNPIADLEKPPLPAARERILSDDELRAVWTAAQRTNGHFGIIVKLLILTGQRRSEIANLRAEWLNENSCTIPASHTKNKRAHTFPIGGMTSAIIGPLLSEMSFLFLARGGPGKSFNGWSKAKAQLDKLAQIGPWTLHDLRRTYATNLQRLGIKLEVIEALLNHISGTRAGIVGVYQRHAYEAEMREAVMTYEAWFARNINGMILLEAPG